MSTDLKFDLDFLTDQLQSVEQTLVSNFLSLLKEKTDQLFRYREKDLSRKKGDIRILSTEILELVGRNSHLISKAMTEKQVDEFAIIMNKITEHTKMMNGQKAVLLS